MTEDLKKICPLSVFAGQGRTPCLEDRCGWWNFQVESCAVAVMALFTGEAILNREQSHGPMSVRERYSND